MLLKVISILFGLSLVNSTLVLPLKRISRAAAEPNLFGKTVEAYALEIQIGTPPQTVDVVVDTGSSTLAVATNVHPYITNYFDPSKSTSFSNFNQPDFTIRYTEGFWRGHMVSDVLSIPKAGLSSLISVPFAEITKSRNFFVNGSNWEGIMGLAYTDLAQPKGAGFLSVFDYFTTKGGIDNIFVMQLCSQKDSENIQGSLILGDSDTSLGMGDIQWTPVVKEWYYEVVIVAIKIGNEMIKMSCAKFNTDKSIVDSGTTNIRLPTDVFNIAVKTIKNYVRIKLNDTFYDSSTLYCADSNENIFSMFPPITFYLPSTTNSGTFSLIIHPQSYLQFSGIVEGDMCYRFAVYPSTTGTVLGTTVMEQYYVVFDRNNKRIGFSRSTCSWIDSGSTVIENQNGWMNTTDCRYIVHTNSYVMRIITYVVLGLLILCFLPIIILCSYNHCGGEKGCCNNNDELSDTTILIQ